MAKEVAEIDIESDSCGIGDWHLGHSPDSRMQEALKGRGVVLSSRAKLMKYEFFDYFDYILAADEEILKHLQHYSKTEEQKSKISLMTAYSKRYNKEEVPDPYYKEGGAFELVLDILEDSCRGLLEYVQKS